ncbi:MAG: DUF1800 domain-containing protein, partial [Bacteroidota bacterium]|nr:DUF1800 domain-containing protein [Bacteroidota bacterium]
DYFKTKTLSQAVNELLTVPSLQPAPPVKNYANSVTAGDPDQAIVAGTTWVNTNTTDGGVESQRISSLKSWWTGLMLNQNRNILEKLVLFWHNHFATETSGIGRAIWCYQNNAVLRKNAIGNFKQFVKDVTLDTGMLRFLNGYLNTNTAPDENYGRELQELFTVGKGTNNATPPYAEADVKVAARVLTGWQINSTTNTSVFTSAKHDINNKQFSSFYSNTVITGRSGAAGANELDDMLNMIFATNEVAMFICRKIYRWFVYYDIDATTEANVITPLAQIFRNNNYEIKPVLDVLFKSEHFFDALNQACQIKSPVDMTISLSREFGVAFPPASDYTNAYYMWDYIRATNSNFQQNIGDPPNVAGWAPYYQEPQFYEIWINSDTYPKRNQFTDTMSNNGYTRNGKNIKIDFIAFAKTLSNPGDPNILMDDSVTYLFRLPLTQASKNQLKTDILLSGQTQDHYWTDAWNLYLANPADATNAAIVKNRLRDLYQYLMKLAEYQLA